MIFFNKKPKVKRENKGDKVTFSIGYFKSQTPEEYKKKVLDKLTESSACLAVLNSDFMYKEQKQDYVNGQLELLSRLDGMGATYKNIAVMRKDDIMIMGLTIKRGEDKSYEDQIIGLVVDNQSYEPLRPILDSYNLHYYIGCSDCSADALTGRFEAGFDKKDKLGEGCKYVVFDDNFMKNLVIYCSKLDAEFTAAMLEGI